MEVLEDDRAEEQRCHLCRANICYNSYGLRGCRRERETGGGRLKESSILMQMEQLCDALVKIDFQDLVVAKSHKWRMISKGQKWKGGYK